MTNIVRWVDNLPPLANALITSSFHGLVVVAAGLTGYASYAAIYYLARGADKIITKLMRGRGREAFPRGWELIDAILDVTVPVAVWLLVF